MSEPAHSFAQVAVVLFMRGALAAGDYYVFCPMCEDVTESWERDSDVCARCGFVIPDGSPCGMHDEWN